MTQKVRRFGQSNTRGGDSYRRKPCPRVDENFRDFAHGWPQQSNPLQGRRNFMPPSPPIFTNIERRKKRNLIISSQKRRLNVARLIVYSKIYFFYGCMVFERGEEGGIQIR